MRASASPSADVHEHAPRNSSGSSTYIGPQYNRKGVFNGNESLVAKNYQNADRDGGRMNKGGKNNAYPQPKERILGVLEKFQKPFILFEGGRSIADKAETVKYETKLYDHLSCRFPSLLSGQKDDNPGKYNKRRQGRHVPDHKLGSQRCAYIGTQDYSKGIIETYEPGAHDAHCQKGGGGAALKNNGGTYSGKEPEKRVSHRKLDTISDSGAKQLLHGGTQFHHPEEKERQTGNKENETVQHLRGRDMWHGTRHGNKHSQLSPNAASPGTILSGERLAPPVPE